MLILSVALLLSILPSPLGNANEGDATPSRADLVLTVDTSKSDFVLYEPVTVNYTVHNPTSKAIRANIVLDLGWQRIEFFITDLTGKTRRYDPPLIVCGSSHETELGPGSVTTSQTDLDWTSGTRLAFPAIGKYEIQAHLSVGGGVSLESNKLAINVTSPSEADAAAIAFFDSEDKFKQLLRSGGWDYCKGRDGSECFNELTRFIEEHGGSAYTPGVVWHLAEAVAHGRVGVEPRYELAVGLRQRFLQQWPDHPNASRVRIGPHGEAAQRRILLDSRKGVALTPE